MFLWLTQFSASASASIKIVVVRFVDAKADADAVLISDADVFGDRREDASFKRRRSTGVNETNKNLLKKLTPTQPQLAASTKHTASLCCVLLLKTSFLICLNGL